MTERVKKAVELFYEGYNCAQSVFVAYADLYGIEKETALRLSASFGGGLGRMRELCGAVSAMSMIAGLATGAIDGKDSSGKQHNYEIVQQMTFKFREKSGSIICKELLGLGKNADTTDTKPEKRTEEYYKKRPCPKLIEDAARIIEETLLKESI